VPTDFPNRQNLYSITADGPDNAFHVIGVPLGVGDDASDVTETRPTAIVEASFYGALSTIALV